MANAADTITTQRRQLDIVEKRGNTAGPTYAVSYAGEIEESHLAYAFDLLRLKYPVLRAHIDPDTDSLYLPSRSDIGGLIVKRLHEDCWRREAVADWETNRTLAQLVLFRGKNRGIVALRMNHAIADATAELHIFHDLWHLYNEVSAEHTIGITEQELLPQSPTEILTERWPNFTEDFRTMDQARLETRHPTANTSDILEREINLSLSDTARITKGTRDHQITVNSLLSAAIMLTVQSEYGEIGIPTLRMNTVINLRNHVSPRVSPTETTNLLASYSDLFRNSPAEDVLQLSRKVGEKIAKAIKENNIVPLGFEHRRVNTTSNSAEYDRLFGVDNLGRIPRFPQPNGLRLDEFFYIMRSAKMPPHNDGLYVPYTYDGRLMILCRLPASDYTAAQVDALVDRITMHILSVGTS